MSTASTKSPSAPTSSSLTINATGYFANTIDLSGVTAAAFATPPPAPTITVNAGAGDDTITGSPLDDIASTARTATTPSTALPG